MNFRKSDFVLRNWGEKGWCKWYKQRFRNRNRRRRRKKKKNYEFQRWKWGRCAYLWSMISEADSKAGERKGKRLPNCRIGRIPLSFFLVLGEEKERGIRGKFAWEKRQRTRFGKKEGNWRKNPCAWFGIGGKRKRSRHAAGNISCSALIFMSNYDHATKPDSRTGFITFLILAIPFPFLACVFTAKQMTEHVLQTHVLNKEYLALHKNFRISFLKIC